jgi:hypothetical protein
MLEIDKAVDTACDVTYRRWSEQRTYWPFMARDRFDSLYREEKQVVMLFITKK